jgi:hypothetical protein
MRKSYSEQAHHKQAAIGRPLWVEWPGIDPIRGDL